LRWLRRATAVAAVARKNGTQTLQKTECKTKGKSGEKNRKALPAAMLLANAAHDLNLLL